jgi:glycosyltransferase involved in cell wall biosynthesis
MRILFCNKYNFRFSGTEVYLFELMDLLRAHGHEVALFSMADARGTANAYDAHLVSHVDFRSPQSWWRRARQAPRMIYSFEARRKIRDIIREFRPDVAHVRNIYHHLTPSILWELKAHGIPVLYHLNDFKLLCPSYNMVARGNSCERCKGGALWNAVRTDCYPGVVNRVALATEACVQRWTSVYERCVDLFLAPSQFVRDKFVEHGWDSNRVRVLPHFQEVHELGAASPQTDAPALYFGRLSPEKGVDDLLRAMRQIPGLRLLIAGDGPQRAELQRLTAVLQLSNVEFVGNVPAEERDSLLRKCRFTIFPSHAYETLGKTILESYAQGRAVIATDLGSRREFVRHGETGLLYNCGDIAQLERYIRLLTSNAVLAERMGRAGWEYVRAHHSAEAHLSNLVEVYGELISRKHSATQQPIQKTRDWPWSRGGAAVVAGAKLRVAFIGGRGVISKYSGIESYYEEVGKRLAATGHDITIYCRNHFTPEVSEYNGMRLVRLPTFRTKHLETLVHTFLSTIHAITRDYDLVHYHALGPAMFSFIPRLFGKKTVVTVQGLDWKRRKWGIVASAVLRVGEFLSARAPNGTMVVSRTLQRHYREAHGVEVRYVPNGGILRERASPDTILKWGLRPERYVLYLGRFSPEKGCHLLVQAFEQIESNVKLVMAGGGSYCDAYSRELSTHASERIILLPWVSGADLDALLTNAMIFVLPSDMEGLSLALLDAMGAGLCVLASDVPENREAVGRAGSLFQSGNVKDLASHLRLLISNAHLRTDSGKAARMRIAEHYDWDDISKQIERVYLEISGLPLREPYQRKPHPRIDSRERHSVERLVG